MKSQCERTNPTVTQKELKKPILRYLVGKASVSASCSDMVHYQVPKEEGNLHAHRQY